MNWLKADDRFAVNLKTDIPDREWLGYQAVISEKGVRKKQKGFAAVTSSGYHFIQINGFEGFTGEKGLTVFPSCTKTKLAIVCPDWKDLLIHVQNFGRQDDCLYVSLNDCERRLGEYVIGCEKVIYAASQYDNGLAHDLAEIIEPLGIEYGTSELNKKRPSVEAKAFNETTVRPQGKPRI